MKFYSGNVGSLEDLEILRALNVGILYTYPQFRRPRSEYYALDNGAYSAYLNHKTADFSGYAEFIKRYSNPDFVVLPDIVEGGLSSLYFSINWLSKAPLGYTYFLAVQNGMSVELVEAELYRFAGLFVGGTFDWKKKTSSIWVKLAHSHNKLCHIGRIGIGRDILWAKAIDADSVDSTSWPRNHSYHHIEFSMAQTQFPLSRIESKISRMEF